MSFLDRLFRSSVNKETTEPTIRFGRYTDSYKEPANYAAWETSLTYFEKNEFEESFISFFKYLRDNRENNVQWKEQDGNITFEILQGSKKITGIANLRQLRAEAKIVHASELNVGFLRRLVEANYALDYSRYALDDENNLVIKFDSSTVDGSPYKLYYALKEVALHADKQDDLLLDEFPGVLTSLETGSKSDLSPELKKLKFDFIFAELAGVFTEIDLGTLNVEKHPGGIAYLLLDAAYKLDYLTKPEGFMMDAFEKTHQAYFGNERLTMLQKVGLMRKSLETIYQRDPTLAYGEFYDTVSTFGVVTSKGHDVLHNLIENELHQMNWYDEHQFTSVALAIPGYIVGYSLFNYALPKPDKALLDLYFHIMEPAYFKSLGFNELYYDQRSRAFIQKTIKNKIKEIADENKKRYPKLEPQVDSLQFETKTAFAKSYLLMIKKLDLTEK